MSTSIDDAVHAHDIEWSDRQVSRLWNYYARTPPYSELYFARVFGRWLLAETGLPAQEPLEVLDFGCGPGFMWDHIRERYPAWRYTGLDFSGDSVAATHTRGAGNDRFREALLVRELPSTLPTGQFDVVLLIEVVEHLKDSYLEGTLREAARVLKTGGVVVVSTPNEEDLARSRKFCPSCGAIFHEWQHVRSWSRPTLRDAMASYGFRPMREVTTDFQARGTGLPAMMTSMRRALRRLLGLSRHDPHLLAVFQKA